MTIAPRHAGQPAPSVPCKETILASDLHLAETLLLVSHDRDSPRTSAYVGPSTGLLGTPVFPLSMSINYRRTEQSPLLIRTNPRN